MQALNTIGQRGCFLLVFSLLSLLLLGTQVQASANTNALQFLDDGTLTLNAEGVPLGTLFGRIQEKTGMEFRIPGSLLKRPIFVSFQSLPLEKAIRRILDGISYVCIFYSNGHVAEIIAAPSAGKPKAKSFTGSSMDKGFPYTFGQENAASPEAQEFKRAMELQPVPDLEDLIEAMGIQPFQERRNP